MFEQKTIAETIQAFNTDHETGLSEQTAYDRLQKNGSNILEQEKPKSNTVMFLEQLNDPLIYILIVAAIISAVLGELSDTVIIISVVLINAVVGVIQEGKAIKALDALKKLTSPTALVKRDGVIHEIAAENLVPGDLVCLESGRQVPADLRLVQSSSLKIEESSLTGESLAVEKNAAFTAKRALAVGDCINMAFMSTNVIYGRGEGIVTATGMQTEIGKIAHSISKAGNEPTPLQRRLADLGKLLSVLAIILCVALFGLAVLQKRDVFEMLLTAISLAVAAVPEGLPAVVTIVLALSVSRMVKINTIIRRLPSVETLGCVNIVCSDKTGTLTQNKMTVVRCFADNQAFPVSSLSPDIHKQFIEGFVLCNDATSEIGDPTEVALIDMGIMQNVLKESLETSYPRINEIPFDSDRKCMSTLHRNRSSTIQYTKGSVEQLLKCCTHIHINSNVTTLTTEHRKTIETAVSDMSLQALRTLGLAYKTNLSSPKEAGLVFLGFVGMIDPIRPEAKDAIQTFKKSGVKTVMITGDHQNTAFAIAKQLEIAKKPTDCLSGEDLSAMSDEELKRCITNISVFSRVSPEHKTRIVRALKANGNIVAMTGDGVNDAPSLKAADIGIAMGKCGTDVAKNAADIVLADDNFATIKKAIEEGRGIYANIKKSVLFLLSSNFGEIITMFLSVLLFLPTPLKPSHILWINLITDTLPALALGTDKNDPAQMMKQQPRPAKESLFTHGGMFLTLFYGSLIATISLLAFLTLPICIINRTPGLSLSLDTLKKLLTVPPILTKCQTYAFTVLGMSQLFHAIGIRNTEKSIFFNTQDKNPLLLISLIIGFILQLIITEVPYLCRLFGTSLLSISEWFGLLCLSTVPLLAHEMLIILKNAKQLH
ncbi:MAG: cation-translocating P-type ATPase [Lachnospiraceae bacterium]|nr:cation-translocating P-type ATPase [Lachnospiraceae bacterium]